MQVLLVKVICDTNFIISLATKRIQNLDSVNSEIGQLDFVIPKVVLKELKKLESNPSKQKDISQTFEFIKKFDTISIDGQYADKEILEYVKNHGGIVATLDKELKKLIRKQNGSILSLSNNRIILES